MNHTHYRHLGSTGIHVSPIGLGTVQFGRNTNVKYPKIHKIPDDHHLIQLLNLAKNLGINLIDTAPAYGDSELRLGKLLGASRQDWIIMSKAGEYYDNEHSSFDFSKQAITQSIHNSLQRLNTDYLDILLIHSDGNDQKIIAEDNVFTTLQDLKKQGLIRSFGMSTKTVAGGLATLEQADLAMVTYNPLATTEAPVIQAASQQNKGIIVKKPFFSGHLDQFKSDTPIQDALEFIFKEPGVSSIICGTLNPNHLSENVATLKNVLNTLQMQPS